MFDRAISAACAVATGLVATLGGCGANSEAQPGPDRQLPVFEFREMVIGQTTSKEAEQAGTVYECRPKDAGSYCKLTKQELAGLPVEYPPFVDFRDGKFSGISLQTPSANFDSIRYALRSSYGKPCPVEQRLLGNAERWCFQHGDLEIRRDGIYMDGFSSIVYSRTSDVDPAPLYTSRTL